jgi:hypothetical protein
MNLALLFWLALAFLAFVILPIVMLIAMRDHLRGKGSERRGGSVTSGVGAAMQELDRILTRPSVEHTIEAETPVLKREDDLGGTP